jgi:hypothetical protein
VNQDGDTSDGQSGAAVGWAPADTPVTVTVWTAPGMTSLSVMYWLNSDSSVVTPVPMSQNGTAADGLILWTASLPSESFDTDVTWWVQGNDECKTFTDYFSNGGNNYFYYVD